jgi:hypothetical protein
MTRKRFSTLAAFSLACISLVGCGPKPNMQSVVAAWQQGDKSTAISRFVATDWSERPLFAPGSTLSLSEEQFKSLPPADREAKMKDMISQISALKEPAMAVLQAGRDAAGKKDVVQARKYFTAVKQYGEALDSPDTILFVKQLGPFFKQLADAELSKLSP